MQVTTFVDKFDDFVSWSRTQQVDYIAYYLTADNETSLTAADIDDTMHDLHLKPYRRTRQYLSENASSTKGKYVKIKSGGYRLTKAKYDEIDRLVKQEPVKVSISTQLTDIVSQVSDNNEKNFLIEALNCYRIEAYRAFIIMVWIVVINHLQMYIFANDLGAFNTALTKSPDRKVKKIVNYDDFSDLSESKLIELARSANIISSDVRKLLDEKLGTRNSAAHPSGIKIGGHKATEFAIDVVNNVLLKYK
ncbi:hypothetical protein JNJ66_03400 [Candidatus Saccharibacteria bacterium]|nr:hypothetical protein [Candidatus Saccharibacteria bacterium]